MSTPARRVVELVECAECGADVSLLPSGKLRRHPKGSTTPCVGTEPFVHIHKCACGSRWDEDA